MLYHRSEFEKYEDKYDSENIPENINFDYYRTTNLDIIIEDLAAHSYSYYEKATSSNNSDKQEALEGTLPYTKEVVAGVLYRFVYEVSEEVDLNWRTNNIQNTFVNKGQSVYYKLHVSTSSNYVITTFSNNDTYLNIYDSNGSQVCPPNDDDGEGRNAKIRCNLVKGKTYLVKLRMWSTSAEGSVNLVITSTEDIPKSSISTGSTSVYLSRSKVSYYKFIASFNGFYNFNTTGNYDTYITLYDNEMDYIDHNDDDGNGLNANINIELEKDQFIYIGVRMYNETYSGTIQLNRTLESHNHEADHYSIIPGDGIYRNFRCSTCLETVRERHSWHLVGYNYVCSKCGMVKDGSIKQPYSV